MIKGWTLQETVSPGFERFRIAALLECYPPTQKTAGFGRGAPWVIMLVTKNEFLCGFGAFESDQRDAPP